jgi:siroheme synthase (precorrin-2 oxidase/ferrochelatase)
MQGQAMYDPKNHPMALREAQIIDGVVENLNLATEEMLNRVPEATFVTYFLPTFCNEDPHPEGDALTWLSRWRDIAGGPFFPVNIVDTKTGAFLYQVPSLLDRHAVQVGVSNPGTPSILSMITTAGQFANVHPQAGQNYILKNIRNYNLFSGSAARMLARTEAWNQIFKRYNKPLIVVQEVNGKYEVSIASAAGSSATTADEGGDIDDL